MVKLRFFMVKCHLEIVFHSKTPSFQLVKNPDFFMVKSSSLMLSRRGACACPTLTPKRVRSRRSWRSWRRWGKWKAVPSCYAPRFSMEKTRGLSQNMENPQRSQWKAWSFLANLFSRYIEIQPGARCGQELTFSALLGARSHFLMVKKHTFPMKWW